MIAEPASSEEVAEEPDWLATPVGPAVGPDIPRENIDPPAAEWDGLSDPPAIAEPIAFPRGNRAARVAAGGDPVDRLWPHDLDSEQAVLGSILIDRDAIVEVADSLHPEDFYRQAHGRVFAAMLALHAGLQPVDVVTVADALESAGDLEAIGGPAYLAGLANHTPTAVHVAQYARIVERKAVLRRLISAAGRIAAIGYEDGQDVDEAIERARAELEVVGRVMAPETGPQLLRVADVSPSLMADIWQVEGLLRPASLAILASAEGIGKSYARLELAIRLAAGRGELFGHYGIPAAATVLLIDEENGPDEEFRREEAVLQSLGIARTDLGDRYHRVSFAGVSLTRPEKQRYVRGLVDQLRPGLVELDTATAMVGDEWGAELKEAVRFLRGLIRDFGCTVLGNVHLTKPPRDRGRGAGQHGGALSDVMGHWARSADVVAVMVDLGAGRARLTVRKRVPPSQLILAQRGGLWETVAVAEDQAAASLEDRVLRAIDTGATSAEELRIALGSADRPVPKASLYRALGALRADGFVADGTPLRLTETGMESVE